MTNSENVKTTSRRDAIQQLAVATAGLSFFSLAACGDNKKQEDPKKTTKVLTPFYLPPAETLQPGPGGSAIRTWIRSSQTNMQYSSVEAAVAPKKMGPSPHSHKDLDEVMLVLEGTASVLVEDTLYEIPAGGWHMRPRGIVHTFFNNTDKPLRFMDMYFNQNFEDYLEELYFKIIPDMVQNKLSPADPSIAKRFAALDLKFGVTMYPEKRQAIIDKYGLIG